MFRLLRSLLEAFRRRRGHWSYDSERISPCQVEVYCACGGSSTVWHSRTKALSYVMRATCPIGRRRARREAGLVPPGIVCHCAGHRREK